MKGSGADPGWGCSGATERVSWVVRTGGVLCVRKEITGLESLPNQHERRETRVHLCVSLGERVGTRGETRC